MKNKVIVSKETLDKSYAELIANIDIRKITKCVCILTGEEFSESEVLSDIKECFDTIILRIAKGEVDSFPIVCVIHVLELEYNHETSFRLHINASASRLCNVMYYADLTPCDDMQNYMEVDFVPNFISATDEFDSEPPIGVVQVATPYGWCVVAKWMANGSTRIYALNEDALHVGVEILSGACDRGDCGYAYGEERVQTALISDDDRKVFFGRDE